MAACHKSYGVASPSKTSESNGPDIAVPEVPSVQRPNQTYASADSDINQELEQTNLSDDLNSDEFDDLDSELGEIDKI